jgi:hypothetical protein
LALGPTGNIQGTYKLMSLLTERLIKAWSFIPLPMLEEVIMQVEKMGTCNLAFDMDGNDSDDMSLSNYSIISQNELADLVINNQTQVETYETTYIPDTIPSQSNKTHLKKWIVSLNTLRTF